MRKRRTLAVITGLLACGLIAAGCGDDDSTTTVEETDATTTSTIEITPEETTGDPPTTAEEASEALEEAVQNCIDNVDQSGLPGDQQETLKDLCQTGGDAAQDQLENVPGG